MTPGDPAFFLALFEGGSLGCDLKPRTAKELALPIREAVSRRVCISPPFGFRECSDVLRCDFELQNLSYAR
jgi:hypothetical protein